MVVFRNIKGPASKNVLWNTGAICYLLALAYAPISNADLLTVIVYVIQYWNVWSWNIVVKYARYIKRQLVVKSRLLNWVTHFQKKKKISRSDLTTPDGRKVTCSRLHNDDSDTLQGATVHNLVVRAIWHPKFVHPCLWYRLFNNFCVFSDRTVKRPMWDDKGVMICGVCVCVCVCVCDICLKLMGETTVMSVYSVSRYKYSHERYRLNHRARYKVGIDDPCMVKEFSKLGRRSVVVVRHGPTARGDGAAALCL